MSCREEKKFSIIIPAYNCERFIKDCLDSIKNQTFENYEIIVINDNSTDATKRRIAEFVAEYPDMDITMISNESNLGVSATRNIGLRQAKGEFILFVDGDDTYSNNQAFEEFNSKLSSDTDLLIFGCQVEHVGRMGQRVLPVWNIYPQEKERQPKKELSVFRPAKTVWQVCFRREFLIQNDIVFQEDINIYEDVIFRQQAVALSRKIDICNILAYKYTRRLFGTSSLTISRSNGYVDGMKKLVKAARKIFELSRTCNFHPETRKHFKRTIWKMPVWFFYLSFMAVFYKVCALTEKKRVDVPEEVQMVDDNTAFQLEDVKVKVDIDKEYGCTTRQQNDEEFIEKIKDCLTYIANGNDGNFRDELNRLNKLVAKFFAKRKRELLSGVKSSDEELIIEFNELEKKIYDRRISLK